MEHFLFLFKVLIVGTAVFYVLSEILIRYLERNHLSAYTGVGSPKMNLKQGPMNFWVVVKLLLAIQWKALDDKKAILLAALISLLVTVNFLIIAAMVFPLIEMIDF